MSPSHRTPTVVLAAVALLTAVVPVLAQTAASPTADAGGEATAHVQPGDQIALRILREPEMSGTFTVSEDGDVVLPRLGRMDVTDLGAVALQDSLRTAYAVYLRDPVIDVTVLRRVGVQGEVHRPSTYMVDLTVTLRDLIAQAGGLTEAGDPRDIVIIRGGQRIRVDEGDIASFTTAELHSGDQVLVGRRSWIAMNPAVALSTATGLISFVITTVLLLKK
ncbi:MAG TPA: polysaccharide biosynthesis/export family protein [Longimicrobiaceae bacterium]|nr:polysaccharide biosynthesis/export family protein [Longimicrobiaceae bacterium]